MRILFRSVLACLVVVALVTLPVAAAPNPALGYVLAAQNAQLDGLAAASGANLYNGDVLATGSRGNVHLQFAANQIYLSRSSGAAITNGASGVTALLTSGTAAFISTRGGGVAVRALDVLVRPRTPAPTSAQVTIMAPNELRVASMTGPLTLTLDGQDYTLAPGKTYGVKVVPENTKFQDHVYSARKSRGLIIFIFAATAAVGGIIYLDRELQESPDTP